MQMCIIPGDNIFNFKTQLFRNTNNAQSIHIKQRNSSMLLCTYNHLEFVPRKFLLKLHEFTSFVNQPHNLLRIHICRKVNCIFLFLTHVNAKINYYKSYNLLRNNL